MTVETGEGTGTKPPPMEDDFCPTIYTRAQHKAGHPPSRVSLLVLLNPFPCSRLSYFNEALPL